MINIKTLFFAFLLSLITTTSYAGTPDYHFSNGNQQRAIIDSVYNEAIVYSNVSKCTIDIDTVSEANDFIVLTRYVDVKVSIIRDRKTLITYSQRVTQADYIKFKYKLDNTVREYCK